MNKEDAINIAAVGNTALVIYGWLPHVTIVLSFIWAVLRIYESKTVQSWLKRRKIGG